MSIIDLFRRITDRTIVPAVTVGSAIEWYGVGLYLYWSGLVGGVFSDYSEPVSEAVNAAIILSTGVVARPLGGYIFGAFGDKKGRKRAFILSLLGVILPSVLILFFHSFQDWGVAAVIVIAIFKFMQGIPAGGEIPGAICYLSEDAPGRKHNAYCSWSLVGPQIGFLLSLLTVYLFKNIFSKVFLLEYGWKISFLIVGLLAGCAVLLRKALHETREFQALEHERDEAGREAHPVRDIFRSHKKEVSLGFAVSIFEVTAFCSLTILPVFFYGKIFELSKTSHAMFSLLTLISCVVLPPFFGWIADKKRFPYLDTSAIGCLLLSIVLYWSIHRGSFPLVVVVHSLITILFNFHVALLPAVLAGLFPVEMRYTGIGFSFNICDGVLWGIIPIAGVFLVQYTHNVASFTVLLPLAALAFILSYHFAKKELRKSGKQIL